MNGGFRVITLEVGRKLRYFVVGYKAGQTKLWEICTNARKNSCHTVEIKSPESESILSRLNQH